jgi:phospholipid-binding lipoprotein MlaA
MRAFTFVRFVRLLVILAPIALTSGAAYAADDRLEAFNRAMFAFNNGLLDNVVDPIEGFTHTSVSPEVRRISHNFYSNMSEWEFVVTNLLKGNYADSGMSLSRMAINTTVGIGGLFDPATKWGLISRSHPEWGEAVCSFGIPPGSYLVLPAIGPANTTSFGIIVVVFAGGYYLLGQIATWLVVVDAVTDVAVGAASLRHVADRPDLSSHDPYVIQRQDYFDYLRNGCAATTAQLP